MFAPSNMYTTKTKIRPSSSVVIVLLFLLFSSSLIAQEKMDVVKPIGKTDLVQTQHDLFAYASGSVRDMALTFLAATNNLYNKTTHPYSTTFGFGVNDFISRKGVVGLNVGLGYTHERIAPNAGFFGNNGVYAHWLNIDANVSALWFSLGMTSDVFLGSRLVNIDNFSFEGINDNCFKSISFATYLSIQLRFTNLKVEAKLGSYLVPHLNPDKLAYYNFLSTHVDSFYYSIHIHYRLFTTGDRKKSPFAIITF